MKSCDCCVVRLEILVTCQMNSYSCEMKSRDCCDSYKICDCVMKFMMAGAMERKKMRKEKEKKKTTDMVRSHLVTDRY